MRYSRAFIPTLKDDPKDATMPSHVLMLRAGYARMVGAGIYELLPLGTRVLQKIERIIREEMDGAGALSIFFYITLPHMSRAITVVILIQTIFLLSIYAEILVTTQGGPGSQSTNITYLVAQQATSYGDIGAASAGGIVAVILANIVAIFLVRLIGKNLDA